MGRLTFFSVLKNNLRCAFCKEKFCRVRYYPNRMKIQIYEGRRYVDSCPKDRDKRWKEMLHRKLP